MTLRYPDALETDVSVERAVAGAPIRIAVALKEGRSADASTTIL